MSIPSSVTFLISSKYNKILGLVLSEYFKLIFLTKAVALLPWKLKRFC